MTKDILCRIMRDEVPARKIYEYRPDAAGPARLAVIVDRNPATLGHVFVTTHEHADRWQDLPGSQIAQIGELGLIVVRRLLEVYPDTDLVYELVAGNQIRHPHKHFIPQYPHLDDDGDPIKRMHPDSDRMSNPPIDAALDVVCDELMFGPDLVAATDERMAWVAAKYAEPSLNQLVTRG